MSESNGVVDRTHAPGCKKVSKSTHDQTDTNIPITYVIAQGTVYEPEHPDAKRGEFPGATQIKEVIPVGQEGNKSLVICHFALLLSSDNGARITGREAIPWSPVVSLRSVGHYALK